MLRKQAGARSANRNRLEAEMRRYEEKVLATLREQRTLFEIFDREGERPGLAQALAAAATNGHAAALRPVIERIRKARADAAEAKNRMAEANLRLVVSIAKRQQQPQVCRCST